MKVVKEDASLYLLTGLLERWEGNNLDAVKSMICDVKEDQFSISADDPEKEYMDEVFKESLNLLETVNTFLTSKNS